jgi:NADPH2:quinone reductase
MDVVPAAMTAVLLERYEGVDGLRVAQLPLPQPGPGQVLVRVAASPINPSDLMFLNGDYGFRRPLPTVPGFEGAGTVVASGGGLVGRFMNGRRVACVSQAEGDGVWAEYVLASSRMVLPLSRGVDLEQGAMSVVNPLTAVAFQDIARSTGQRAILQTAAASALGQMVVRLARGTGLTVVNVVRRQEQVDLLRAQDADVVLNSSEPDFDARLAAACQEHGVRLVFDAVGGSLTDRLLAALPRGGRVVVYGGLAGAAAEADWRELVFRDKHVQGFWLTEWIGRKNLLQLLRLWQRAQRLMQGALRTEIRARYALEDVQTAVRDYEAQMTGGKVLLIANSQ